MVFLPKFGEQVRGYRSLESISDRNSVFTIAATGTWVQFLHFEFDSHYRSFIDPPNATTSRACVAAHGDETFVRMKCTNWFDLRAAKGRKIAMCHVLAILRFHEASAMSFAPSPSKPPVPGLNSAETSFDSNPPSPPVGRNADSDQDTQMRSGSMLEEEDEEGEDKLDDQEYIGADDEDDDSEDSDCHMESN